MTTIAVNVLTITTAFVVNLRFKVNLSVLTSPFNRPLFATRSKASVFRFPLYLNRLPVIFRDVVVSSLLGKFVYKLTVACEDVSKPHRQRDHLFFGNYFNWPAAFRGSLRVAFIRRKYFPVDFFFFFIWLCAGPPSRRA